MHSPSVQNSDCLKSKRKSIDIRMPTVGTINAIRKTKSTGNSQQEEMDETSTSTESNLENGQSSQEAMSASSRRIRELVMKTTEMKHEQQERDNFMEEKFADLRARINNSVAFLRSTKNQIENIKFLYQKDMLDSTNHLSFGDCLTNSDKSIDELNKQIEEIQKKLNSVRAKANLVKGNCTNVTGNQSFENTVTNAVNALDKIGRGEYEADNIE